MPPEGVCGTALINQLLIAVILAQRFQGNVDDVGLYKATAAVSKNLT